MRKIVDCPVGDWTCPYLKEDVTCGLVDEGVHPRDECDDYYAAVGDEED